MHAFDDHIAMGRENLGFIEAVDAHLAPSLSAYGFTRGASDLHSVQFFSPDVTVTISHDDFSFEISVIVSRTADPSERYALPDIVDARLGPDHRESVFFQASSPERVLCLVRAIAELLTTHGEPALRGDPEFYQQMSAARTRQAEILTKQVIQRPIRTAAETAWRARDYGVVRDLYERIAPDLTEVEQQRLEYARRHSTR